MVYIGSFNTNQVIFRHANISQHIFFQTIFLNETNWMLFIFIIFFINDTLMKVAIFWCFNHQQNVSTNGICGNHKGTANVNVPKSSNRVNKNSSNMLLELAFMCNFNT
jgi:hypothetical protein